MTDEQKHYPWNEGSPTKPDVDALMKAFPVETLTVGRRITDEEVRAATGIGTGIRYRTVYAAWVRRLQKDHAINLFRENTIGFFVPTADEVTARTHPALQHMGRTAKKQIRNLAAARVENDQQRVTVDHQGRLLNNIARETKKARMNVLAPSPIQEPVKLTPPPGRISNSESK